MKKLFKCSVCNFVWQGEIAPDICPKCGQPHEKFAELTAENAGKIYKSERTNDIHMEIITLIDKVIVLSHEGVKLDLDPACVNGFKQAINEGYTIKQRSKAEIENHIGKGKW
jgi:rubredoxin